MLPWSLHVCLLTTSLPFQVSSYGGFLTYQVKSFGLPADMALLGKQPDVQLTVGTSPT